MKFTDRIMVNRKIETVFAWIAQPEHLIQWIQSGPAGQKTSIDPLSPTPDEASSLRTHTIESEVEIQNLSAIPLRVGATFQYVIRIRIPSHEWRTSRSSSVEITEYVPPHSLAFKARSGSHLPVHHRMTLHSLNEGTTVSFAVTTPFGWLPSLIPQYTSFSKKQLTGQMRMLKAQLEIEAE
jgi:hypothetical protein